MSTRRKRIPHMTPKYANFSVLVHCLSLKLLFIIDVYLYFWGCQRPSGWMNSSKWPASLDRTFHPTSHFRQNSASIRLCEKPAGCPNLAVASYTETAKKMFNKNDLAVTREKCQEDKFVLLYLFYILYFFFVIVLWGTRLLRWINCDLL